MVNGAGYVRIGEETTPFGASDLFMIPHGDQHEMGNGTGAPLVSVDDRLPELLTGRILRSRLGGGGEVTPMICGYLAFGSALIRPVLAGLPRVVRVRLRNDDAGQWLEKSIVHALARVNAGGPGSEVILARRAEALFVDALQRYATQLPSWRTGWLAGALDPAVGRCLAAMHRQPGHAWTLDALAKAASLSRSALTERFIRYLGLPPMGYLTQVRLELAAEELSSTNRTVLQIAAAVGYQPEAAFNRAFKRVSARRPPSIGRRRCEPGWATTAAVRHRAWRLAGRCRDSLDRSSSKSAQGPASFACIPSSIAALHASQRAHALESPWRSIHHSTLC